MSKKLLFVFNCLSVLFLLPTGILAECTQPMVVVANTYTAGLKDDGTVISTGSSVPQQNWSDVIQIDAGMNHLVGLKNDGTVVTAIAGGDYWNLTAADEWTDIVQVVAGAQQTLGIRSDGTVVATGDNRDGQLNVKGWHNIIQLSIYRNFTVGLKEDGTVVAVGDNNKDQLNVTGWTDIVQVAAGVEHTIGLKSDGTIVKAGDASSNAELASWHNIVQVSSGHNETIGLKSDGTVVAAGGNGYGELDVEGWSDNVMVSLGYSHSVGLRSDNTVVAAGFVGYGATNVNNWNLGGFCENSGLEDSDSDGITDDFDLCPNTPLNTNIDLNGCPIECIAQSDVDQAISQAIAERDEKIVDLQLTIIDLTNQLFEKNQKINELNAKIALMFSQDQLDQAAIESIAAALKRITRGMDLPNGIPGTTTMQQLENLANAVQSSPACENMIKKYFRKMQKQ